MTLEQAIDIVARQALRNAMEMTYWEDFPTIAESDWDRVQARGQAIASADQALHTGTFNEAITYLESRVTNE